jgi:hypothetical protein
LAIGLPEPAEPKGGVRAIGLDGRKGGVTAVAEMEKPGGSTGEDCIGQRSIVDEQKLRASVLASMGAEHSAFLDAATEGKTDTGEGGEEGGISSSLDMRRSGAGAGLRSTSRPRPKAAEPNSKEPATIASACLASRAAVAEVCDTAAAETCVTCCSTGPT